MVDPRSPSYASLGTFLWDGAPADVPQRGERNDRDPVPALHRFDCPSERVLYLGRGEIQHTRHTTAPRPGPADAGKPPRSLDRQLHLNCDGQPVIGSLWPQHEIGAMQK